MSIEDLEKLIEKTEVEPPEMAETSSIDELIGKRENIDAIAAQRSMENRFNNPNNIINIQTKDITETSEPPAAGEYIGLTAEKTLQDISFVLGYSSRIIRSVLALSGLTARAERFGDVRKSEDFWTAIMSLQMEIYSQETRERTVELVKKIPSLLTDPSVPEDTIPSVGRLITGPLPELTSVEWVYNVLGELIIEANVAKQTKILAKKGINKLTNGAFGAGEEIVKKKGIKRLLGSLDDDELRAIDEAVQYRKVGKLGTKPHQGEIDDAVRRTFEYIDESKPSRLTKKEVISSKRKKAAAQMYDIQGDGYGPGYSARMTKAGAIESTEKSYKPLLEVSEKATDDLMTLQRTIDNFDFGGSKIYTTSNTQRALARLYEYGELLTPGEVEGLRDVFGSSFADSLTKFTARPTGIAGKMFDAGTKGIRGLNNTARTLMTTGELSFLLRQGNYRAWTRPKDAIRSWSVSMRSLISPKYADQIDDVIRFSRQGKIGTEHGLWFGKWRNIVRQTEAEEVFMAQWIDKVPGLGKYKKGFERGYVNGLNQIRLDWFDEGLQLIDNAVTIPDKALVSEEVFKAATKKKDKLISKWATYVNNMAGRADLDNIKDANKALKNMAETAKTVLFAPRFSASKWNRHKVAAEIMFGRETPNSMRRLLAGDAVKKWRRYERLAHYFNQSGGSVEEDPRSSDFLKLKAGDTRFDVLGGDSQIQVLLARIASGQTKDLHTGLLKDNISTEIAQQYLAGKLNPLWSTLFDKFVAQQSFEGEDINDPKVLTKVVRDKFIPLYITDIKDKIFNEYEEQGKSVAESIEGTLPTIALGFAGAGIQTFEPSARKKYELMINDKAQELYAKDFRDLPYYLKEEVTWEAENDDIDKTELLKEEMGMFRPTPGTSARLTKIKNKSFRAIRKGLGNDFVLFKESNVPVREFPIDIGDIRLSDKQHDKLSQIYVRIIKEELSTYPEISRLSPLSFERRQWLQDIESNAREDAIEEIKFLD